MQLRLMFAMATVLTALLSFRQSEKLSTSSNGSAAVTAVPLYRLSDSYGYHFYTTNEAEKNATIKDLHYNYEGILGYVFPQQVPGTVPLFRYRSELEYITNIEQNQKVRIARHFYTTNQNDDELKFKGTYFDVPHADKGFSMKSYINPYTSEGIQGYVSTTNVAGAAPIFRLFMNRYTGVDDGDHGKLVSGAYDNFYTNDEPEKFSAIYKYSYTDKGIAFYTWKTAVSK